MGWSWRWVTSIKGDVRESLHAEAGCCGLSGADAGSIEAETVTETEYPEVLFCQLANWPCPSPSSVAAELVSSMGREAAMAASSLVPTSNRAPRSAHFAASLSPFRSSTCTACTGRECVEKRDGERRRAAGIHRAGSTKQMVYLCTPDSHPLS